MADSYECPQCGGCGKIELTGVYAETLKQVRARCRKSADYIIAHRDAGVWFDCRATALNNRLNRLEELGLLTSVRYGKQRRFKPV